MFAQRHVRQEAFRLLTQFARAVTLTIESETYAGDFAVVRSTNSVDTVGAQAGRPDVDHFVIDYRITTIFEFRGNKISAITDYVDYEAVKAQIAAAR